MDMEAVLAQLRAERERLERAIADIEQLVAANGNRRLPGGKRRGRTFMGDAERAEVSKRMRKYWANWRKVHESPRGAGPNPI